MTLLFVLQQYNDTLVTLQKVMAVASDQFSDVPRKVDIILIF